MSWPGPVRRGCALFGLTLALAACGDAGDTAPEETSAPVAAPTPTATQPDLAACKPNHPFDHELMQRSSPIPVPPEFVGLVASAMQHFAVTAMAGNTICIDTSWMDRIEKPALSPDRRFLSFDWLGYEEFGHVLVDRSGQGMAVDTGNPPLASPDGKRLASVDLSESGFGALNAFAVWAIEPVGLTQLARIGDGLPAGDWRMEGWTGNECVRLSLVPIDRYPENGGDFDGIPRDPWHAAQTESWRPAPGPCPAA